MTDWSDHPVPQELGLPTEPQVTPPDDEEDGDEPEPDEDGTTDNAGEGGDA